MASKTSSPPSPSAITTRTTPTVSSVREFYDYIEQLASEPVKLLCKVQGIRSMVALADTTKDEILNEDLCYEEDDNYKEMTQ
ncbi:unnamed protein product [Didymodactylos carnosus]|uniref:Uncharacterized protein n=1 Tax=Didymodactylos carnosus TaxID=1234261 RepID=A0A8S2FJM3_9BILA|nr:unnamed protein product [Didymodactylos carnosus]CAF4279902.1 unnamed protein product [Didymodactylos carnosus]